MTASTLALPPLAPGAWGLSTGALRGGDAGWSQLVERALGESDGAIELAALAGEEWAGLVAFLRDCEPLQAGFVSVHAPTKRWRFSEAELVDDLVALPDWIGAVVVHPDAMHEPVAYGPVGERLAVENMDPRKPTGRTADELAPVLEALPRARVCFDIAHAATMDPTLEEASRILDRYGDRLSHLHVSELDADCRHMPLMPPAATRWAPLLSDLRGLPWILEA